MNRFCQYWGNLLVSFNLYNTVSFDEMIKMRVNNPIWTLKLQILLHTWITLLCLNTFNLQICTFVYMYMYKDTLIRLFHFIIGIHWGKMSFCWDDYFMQNSWIVELWICGASIVEPLVWILWSLQCGASSVDPVEPSVEPVVWSLYCGASTVEPLLWILHCGSSTVDPILWSL